MVGGGANVNARALDGWTPLAVAAREGHNDTIEELLSDGADINYAEAGGNSPIFWAGYYGHRDSVVLLLSKGADPQEKCDECMFPAEAAEKMGHKEIAGILSNSATGKQ